MSRKLARTATKKEENGSGDDGDGDGDGVGDDERVEKRSARMRRKTATLYLQRRKIM